MVGMNINGIMYISYLVICCSMWFWKKGVILNVFFVIGFECLFFDGEVVYYVSKVFLEGFSNSLRMEMFGFDIKVLML